jgi:hypothetical protein
MFSFFTYFDIINNYTNHILVSVFFVKVHIHVSDPIPVLVSV